MHPLSFISTALSYVGVILGSFVGLQWPLWMVSIPIIGAVGGTVFVSKNTGFIVGKFTLYGLAVLAICFMLPMPIGPIAAILAGILILWAESR